MAETREQKIRKIDAALRILDSVGDEETELIDFYSYEDEDFNVGDFVTCRPKGQHPFPATIKYIKAKDDRIEVTVFGGRGYKPEAKKNGPAEGQWRTFLPERIEHR